MKFSPRIIIKSIKYWGGMCPFQMEGKDVTGRPFYLRSRHEGLRVYLGAVGTESAVMGEEVFSVFHPEDSEEWGYIDLYEVVQLTGGFIRWPWKLRLRARWEGLWFVRCWHLWKMERTLTRQLDKFKEKP